MQPVGTTGTASGGDSASSGATEQTGGRGETTSGSSNSEGGPASGDEDLVAGSFAVGERYALPVDCSVEFHLPSQIDATSGATTAFVVSKLFVVDERVSAFSIQVDEVVDVVTSGDDGFVTARCDIDGNGLFDDGVGAYHNGLPATRVTLPALDIELELVAL